MSSLPLSGQVALITGATKGIGRSVALKLLSQGASVAVTYGSDDSAAKALAESAGSSSTNLLTVRADASGSVASMKSLVETVVAKFSHIDILIPNAGLLNMIPSIANITEAQFDKAYNMNVKGPMFLVQQAVPHMPRGGRIVFMSTTQNFASTVSPPYLLYCSTKGAIDQMTRVLAKELPAQKGISVNAVAPGPTGTDLFYQGKSEALLKQIASLNPNNRIGEPDEIADAVVFLSGPGAAWVNGQILKVNGGQYVG